MRLVHSLEKLLCVLAFVCWPSVALAHAFAQPYALPVPFGYYAWGASIALMASFVMVGAIKREPAAVSGMRPRVQESGSNAAEKDSWIAGGVGLALLLVNIATGLVGTANPYANLNMTFFWILFVLGVPYAVALVGNFYAPFNPWKALVGLLEIVSNRRAAGVVRIGARGTYLPALLLYMGFILLELFAHLTPRGLAIALTAYTVINVLGAFLLGKEWWFRHGEFFAVMLDLVGRMSARPKGWTGSRRSTWTVPLSGLVARDAQSVSLVMFILFMLSSTAFDGMHATLPFTNFFFGSVYALMEPILSGTSRAKVQMSAQLYYVWQWLVLILSPFLYLASMFIVAAAMKFLTRSRLTASELVSRFAMSLVPIAFVYHVAHYYALLLSQGPQIARLASDPFGLKWDLFGTASADVQPVMVGSAELWLSQVGLIVVGHVASVYLAHQVALRTFESRRAALVSQLPMLVLMVGLTTLGLWILSLPLAPGA